MIRASLLFQQFLEVRSAESTFLGISVDIFRRLLNLDMTLQLLEKEDKGPSDFNP